jgi:4'-phosphopantetheinyl transferase
VVEVWWTTAEHDETLLSEDERARRDQLVLAKTRREYVTARSLVRMTLSRYADVDPRSWTFRTNAWGRPELSPPSELRFNVSHADGIVVCAVTRGRELGVDVERVDRVSSNVAEDFFAPCEVAALRAMPPAAQPERFLDYWTLKEAYIKARGMGLALALHEFWIRFDPLVLEVANGDDPQRWQLAQLRLPDHLIAVCVERGDGPIVLREA